MSTPEGTVKNKVKKILKMFNAYWHCPVQNGMGAPSLDFVCCYHGKYVAIETKAPGKKPTPRQEITIGEIRAAGGKVLVISDDDGCKELAYWMKAVGDAATLHYTVQAEEARRVVENGK